MSNNDDKSDPASGRPANVIDLSTGARRKKALSKTRKTRAKGVTLCNRGFHKWTDEPKKQFDVKQGKLISIRRCARCGLTKTQTS